MFTRSWGFEDLKILYLLITSENLQARPFSERLVVVVEKKYRNRFVNSILANRVKVNILLDRRGCQGLAAEVLRLRWPPAAVDGRDR